MVKDNLQTIFSKFYKEFTSFRDETGIFHKEFTSFRDEVGIFYKEFTSFRDETGIFHKEFTSFRDEMGTDMREVKEVLAQHSQTLSQHTHSLLTIENELKSYGDMYQINKDSIKKIDGRLRILENK